MKMIMCVCSVSIVNNFVKILDKHNVHTYHIIKEVTGRIHKGDPRLNTPVYPGYNAAIFIPMIDHEKAKDILQAVETFHEQVGSDAKSISCTSWSLDSLV